LGQIRCTHDPFANHYIWRDCDGPIRDRRIVSLAIALALGSLFLGWEGLERSSVFPNLLNDSAFFWGLFRETSRGQTGCRSELDLNFRDPLPISPTGRTVAIVQGANGVAFCSNGVWATLARPSMVRSFNQAFMSQFFGLMILVARTHAEIVR
jgi:hypothetical protein